MTEERRDDREPMPPGPYLAAAFLCEKALQERDGVWSFIRVVDRRTLTAQGPAVPDTMPPSAVDWTLVLNWKSGAARGRHEVTLDLQAPSGAYLPATPRLDIHFDGNERGAQMVVGLNLVLQEEGLYWIDVRLDRAPVTRIPFRLAYQRASAG